ncbi:hypothetical protein Kpol_1013p20 [Vanderwaltozyma polyspora DSM 70294]|uniref:M-phase inducer phosphatase n=1 Tax=Vanderwaltozyma polyspora (strain ATCC 22028 / DSM 70294 / BCRC 21397 / CBS 2163 / NBRC 10782 / NRRL Y-8283 / UCD 57-17) TaxID=436907 RepID=A7TH68_VANPO|nr:uncharacterized protein Kpol_1013p20 [Vanderwaltozyma polyspora DSM 70294]EDO18349.1 hypothetical protein Kpol_1013p20 [Vanderwaltozyma polyspora DSM 70294]
MSGDHQFRSNTSLKDDAEGGILRKMSLGSPFQDSSKFIKNIHSYLKSKKKTSKYQNKPDSTISTNNSPNSDDLAINIDTSFDIDESPLGLKITSSDQQPFSNIYSLSPTKLNKNKTNDTSIQLKSLDTSSKSKQPLPFTDLSNDLDIISQSNSEITKRSIIDDSSIKRNLLDLRLDSPKSSPRNDKFNHKYNNAVHKNQDSSKKDRRKIKTQRAQSLKRINSMYSNPKELENSISKMKEESKDDLSSMIPKQLFESRLSSSNISVYYNKSNNEKDHFPRITASTLKKITQDKIYEPHYSACYIVDCRFEYEYSGGHILNAMNVPSKDELEWELLNESILNSMGDKPILLVFHCEFSSYRSPIMASHLRNCDRILNQEQYPELLYPDILILDGGYKSFYDEFPKLCYPCNYVCMDSQENLATRNQEMGKFRNDSKRNVSRNSSLYRLTSISRSTTKLKTANLITTTTNDTTSQLYKSQTYNSSFASFKPEPPKKSIFSRYQDNDSFESIIDSSPISRNSAKLFYGINNLEPTSKSIFSDDTRDYEIQSPTIGQIFSESKTTNPFNESDSEYLDDVPSIYETPINDTFERNIEFNNNS